jgi:HNH endonuclease
VGLTFQRAHEVLKLDPETGVLTWRISRLKAKAGKVAGCVEKRRGYVLVRIDKVLYSAHDIIWLMVYGEWCPGEVDHIDRITGNNRPSNLRKATQQENLQNKSMQSNNTSGYRGVYWNEKAGMWVAQVEKRINGKRVNRVLGQFADKHQAAEVARVKRLEMFGEFAPSYDRAPSE